MGGGDASLPGMMNPRLTHTARIIGALEQASTPVGGEVLGYARHMPNTEETWAAR